MPFSGFGPWEMIFVLVVLLLVFGARRLPEIGSSLGRGIREFKRSVSDIQSEINRPGDDKRDLRPSEPPRASVSSGDTPRTKESQPSEERREQG